MALSYPKKLTSSASFSPSIRISLRLKIHQAQAKNFCRVLDIRVTKIVESDTWQVICFENSGEVCSHETRLDDFTYLIDIDVIKVTTRVIKNFLALKNMARHFGHRQYTEALFFSLLVKLVVSF